MARRKKGSPARGPRLKIHETTAENDIRYLGPLHIQHFKLFGWICIIVAQAALLLKLGGRFDPVFAADSAGVLNALQSVGELALPFLLIANFAQILNAEEGYGRQLLFNGAASAGICALYWLVFYRYIVGNVAALLKDPADALPTVQTAVSLFAPYGFFAFNIFIDLFLCTLTMVFLNHRPTRVFTGKWVILFRLLAVLPIGYEVASMLLKINAARGAIVLPAWVFPLMTVKPPMTFVLFVALALFVKTRELRFRRHGKTHEDYQAFLKTRRNSLNFSVFLAIMLVVVSLLDLAVTVGFSINEAVHSVELEDKLTRIMAEEEARMAEEARASLTEEEARMAEQLQAALDEAAAQAGPEATAAPGQPDGTADGDGSDSRIMSYVDSGLRMAVAVGFGGSISLFLLAPFVLLFSYTRKPKYAVLNLAIPAAGVTLILFLYLEGIHQLLWLLPIPKVDLAQLKEMARTYITMILTE